MSLFSKWAKTEYPLYMRIAGTLFVGCSLFVFLFPYLILVVCSSVDRQLGWHFVDANSITYIIGGVMIALGAFFALWSIFAQLTLGRGTPIPIMATQKLLIIGPFRYCRNPMLMGTILAYFGISVAWATISGFILTLCFSALFLLYIKNIEEKELIERFGEEYLVYKKEVPFIIPKLYKKF